mmetsp:Transcript_23630/g.61702  ORF Transcript_23630/g.61702 Transcript_23630/m.61702 type:complete len:683 (-) Transcript_23630:30-2078(-)
MIRLLTLATAAWAIKRPPRGGERRNRIAVVGSANLDTTLAVGARLPTRGETVSTRGDPLVCCGGKGANQAVACARLVDDTLEIAFYGRVGSDTAGEVLVKELQRANVDISGVRRVAGGSGQGFVLLEDGGTVLSVVNKGANHGWDLQSCDDAWAAEVVQNARVVLLQREVPERINEVVARSAQKAGAIVVQDCGGEEREMSDEHLARCTYVAPNVSELARLTGRDLDRKDASDADVDAACHVLIARGATKVLATLGSRGCRLVSRDGVVVGEACTSIKAVDETAAGDAFRAAFAVALAEGLDERTALRHAAAAGAAAVTKEGAQPSLPSREERDALLPSLPDVPRGGGKRKWWSLRGGDTCPWKFASRLNSMKDRRDLAEGFDNDPLGWVRRQGTIDGLDLVDFNFPEHLGGLKVEDVQVALKEADLKCGAVCLRYPASKFRRGSLTHPDPEVRREAIQLTIDACVWAQALGASEVVVWSAWDGYDYSLQCDYDQLWQRLVAGFQQVCDAAPDVRVSLEFKPTDENTRFFAVPSTGSALVLCQDVDRENFGLTIDIGHCLAAGENPAQSIAQVASKNKLFGVQLNDGYQRIGAEDGLVFGSVHPTMAREFIYWLRRNQFDGHIYFDTFPRSEDPVRECELNIRTVKRFYGDAAALEADGLQGNLDAHDAMSVLELLERRGMM